MFMYIINYIILLVYVSHMETITFGENKNYDKPGVGQGRKPNISYYSLDEVLFAGNFGRQTCNLGRKGEGLSIRVACHFWATGFIVLVFLSLPRPLFQS